MMKDFFTDICEYLGVTNPEVDVEFIGLLWLVHKYISGDINEKAFNDQFYNIQNSLIYCTKNGELDIYSLLCQVCFKIARAQNSRLGEKLHTRIVLGEQNIFTKDYIRAYGV